MVVEANGHVCLYVRPSVNLRSHASLLLTLILYCFFCDFHEYELFHAKYQALGDGDL